MHEDKKIDLVLIKAGARNAGLVHKHISLHYFLSYLCLLSSFTSNLSKFIFSSPFFFLQKIQSISNSSPSFHTLIDHNTSPHHQTLRLTSMGFKPFLEGGIAAIIAGALTHPLDLIKVRMQLQGEHSFSLDQNTNHNLDLNLPVKPYRPVFALDSLIGSISLLPSSTPAPSSSTRSSMTPFAVGAHIVKTEGPAALFSGVSATVLRQMLYSATRMGIYDFLKRKWTDRLTGNYNKFY